MSFARLYWLLGVVVFLMLVDIARELWWRNFFGLGLTLVELVLVLVVVTGLRRVRGS